MNYKISKYNKIKTMSKLKRIYLQKKNYLLSAFEEINNQNRHKDE